MKRFLKGFSLRILLLNILVLYSMAGFSAKYYVDVTGSNSNNGSSTSPWRTLAHACTNVTTPGDIIHLNAGTFNETLRANVSLGVSIEGAGRDVTIINSSYVATNSSDGVIRLNSSSSKDGNQSISHLTLTGSNLKATRGIAINYRNNVTVHDCKVSDFYASAIFFRGNNNAWDVEPNPYCSGNKIYNCIVNNSATRSSGESASVRIGGQNGFLFYNNTCAQTSRPSGENGNVVGGGWNKGLKIYDNTFTKTDNEASAWNFFFELWHWQGGGEIYRNTFNGAATMDIVNVTKSTYDYGLKIYDNKYLVSKNVPFTAHQVQAINLEGRNHLDDIHVYNNYMKNVTNGIWVDVTVNTGEGYTSFAVNNLYIHHNVMENVGMTDVKTIPIWMNAYGSNKNISFNNININNNTIQSSSIVKPRSAIKWSVIGQFSNIFIQNNIFTNCLDNVLLFSSSLSGATLSNVTIKNNLYYNNGVNATKFDMPVTNSVESGNVVGNPMFVSSTNYNLQAGSPAINKGLNIGYSYNGTAPDLGAYETGTAAATSTADNTKPVISAFRIPESGTSLTTSILDFTATDNVGITGYMITRSTIPPAASSAGWSSTKPTSFTFTSSGTKTLFAWVKDDAGNVSSYRYDGIIITANNLSAPPDEVAKSTHFEGSSSENASAAMDIEITGINNDLLSVGDEMAIFDGSTCVSSVILSSDDFTDGFVRISAPLSDESQQGFVSGHPIQIRAWDALKGEEYLMPAEVMSGQMVFEAQTLVVVKLRNLTTDVTDVLGSIKLEVYPNPCIDAVTVRFSEMPEIGSRIEIVNNAGKRIAFREIKNSQETFHIKEQPAGLYVVKTTVGRNEFIHKLIKNQ